MKIIDYIKALRQIVFPQKCASCGNLLNAHERFLCTTCLLHLPYTGYKGKPGNPVERKFWEQKIVLRATAYLHYFPGTDSARPVLALKYFGKTFLGEYLGTLAAQELATTDFFDGIDFLVPLPLHKDRKASRGYNQSYEIARGVRHITQLPIKANYIKRVRANQSQTHLSGRERRENVADIFKVTHPQKLRGKHILLIDDVLTTGATLLSCITELAQISGLRVSILTLYVTGRPATAPNIHHPDVTTLQVQRHT
ncbi:MAG: ComF family protein [Alloprevotella sp.]|nr:ComF family protein [Alloprevotella sp.]